MAADVHSNTARQIRAKGRSWRGAILHRNAPNSDAHPLVGGPDKGNANLWWMAKSSWIKRCRPRGSTTGHILPNPRYFIAIRTRNRKITIYFDGHCLLHDPRDGFKIQRRKWQLPPKRRLTRPMRQDDARNPSWKKFLKAHGKTDLAIKEGKQDTSDVSRKSRRDRERPFIRSILGDDPVRQRKSPCHRLNQATKTTDDTLLTAK